MEKLFKARFTHESDEKYPKDALHVFAENEPAMKRNEVFLNDFPGDLYTIEANDKIPDNCKYPLSTVQAAQNQKQTNAGVSAKLLKLKIGAKVVLTVNIDIQNRLINDQKRNASHIKLPQGSVG